MKSTERLGGNVFDKRAFINFILENSVVGFFDKPVKLRSGRLSHWYVDWRWVTGDVYLIDQLSEFVIEFVNDLGLRPDCFYGVPEGATKLGIITQYKYAKKQPDFARSKYPLPMGRGKIKEHGLLKDRYFVGVPKGKVIVLEDVTTTGGSLIETISRLNEIGTKVTAAISLTDRMELREDGLDVKTAVENLGVPYYTMSTASEVLPKACKYYGVKKEVICSIEEYFEKYGVTKVKLMK